jgi:hypothetical protein
VLNCRDVIVNARTRLSPVCILVVCCLLALGASAAARPAAAANAATQPRDPSYSQIAQRDAVLSPGLLAGATFTPNDLITDANFTAVGALSQSGVQSFLAAQSGILGAYQAADHTGVTRSAAAIVCQAAVAWQVSPKVILVTLQKEQGLLTAAQPSASALAWAMGCGVPDSGSRNTAYEGFGNQVWYGAESLHDDGQGWQAGVIKVCGDGTVQPVDQASYALYRYTPWIGVNGGGNKLFWTVYWRYFGDPLAGTDVAPVTTVAGADAAWHDQPVTLTFSAAAGPGSSDVSYTQWMLDQGPWTSATTLTVSAPADHSGDGAHTVLYRSADVVGTVEAARTAIVNIDTRPPKPVANWVATVRRGRVASLPCYVGDARPGAPTADVTIRVRTLSGSLVRKLVVRGTAVDQRLAARFVCKLAAGQYRFFVYATDAAGNTQSSVASNRLVVR